MPSYLLVSLANLGPKMFNVTKINGIVSDVKSGKALANFTRRMYGDPLGPREQRSFRYPFVPNKKLSPGEYQMTFSIFYANRDKEGFSTEVYSGKQVLVRASPRLACPVRSAPCALPRALCPCGAVPGGTGSPHAPPRLRTNPRVSRPQPGGRAAREERAASDRVRHGCCPRVGDRHRLHELGAAPERCPQVQRACRHEKRCAPCISTAPAPIDIPPRCKPTPPTLHPDHLASPGSYRPVAMAARRALAQEEEVACCQADMSRRWPRFARRELPR